MLSTNVAKYNFFRERERERERKRGDPRKKFCHVRYISHFYKFQLNFGSSNSFFFFFFWGEKVISLRRKNLFFFLY